VNKLDSRDWFSPAGLPPDALNQFSTNGVDNTFTAVDVREMNVLGYDLPSVPEPSTMLVAGVGGLAFACYGWRRRRRGTGEAAG
jgi:hypothetical protein